MQIVYLVCNDDELQLPIAVVDKIIDVAKVIGCSPQTLYNMAYECFDSRYKNFWMCKSFLIFRICI